MPDHVMPLPVGLVALARTIGPGEPDKLAFPGARGAVIGNWSKWTQGDESEARDRRHAARVSGGPSRPCLGKLARRHMSARPHWDTRPATPRRAHTTRRPISLSASSTSGVSPIGSTCLKRAVTLSFCRGGHDATDCTHRGPPWSLPPLPPCLRTTDGHQPPARASPSMRLPM